MISRKLLRILAGFLLLAGQVQVQAKAPERAGGEGVAPALESLLAGEFALQSGDFEQAASHYEAATRATNAPSIAERATRIALMANDLPMAERNLARWLRLDPASTDALGVALQLDLVGRHAEQAQAHARALVAREGGWHTLLGLLSQPATDDGAAARAALRAAVEDPAFPPGIEPGLAFTGLARRLGETALARGLVDRLADAHPGDARLLVAGATLDREAGAKDAARARLERALALPLAADVRRSVAGELQALGDPGAAAKVMAATPQDDTTYMLRAAWLFEAGDTAGLAALDREIQGAGLNPSRRLLLGQIAEVRSDWAAAEHWYRGVDSGPERDRARLRVAAVLERQGQAAAGANWLRGLQRDAALEGEVLRDAYLFEAELWGRQDDDRQALAAFARGLAIFEDDPVLLYGRAMQHVRRERIDAGLADLHRILDLDADHPEALNAYGYTLAEHKQRYAEALRYVEKSNRLQPGSAATLDSLGWILLKLGEPQRALPLLREAWGRDQDAEIAAHLGEVLWLSGERDEARTVWARGRELDKDNKALRATLEKYRP
jgi:tetratricopeptide (TPR) repeat protein